MEKDNEFYDIPESFKEAEQFTQEEMEEFFTRQFLACEDPIKNNRDIRTKSLSLSFNQIFI